MIPTVPTDNLYKFMAIVGLLMVAAGLVVPAYFDLEYIKIKTRYDVAELDWTRRAKMLQEEAEFKKELHDIVSSGRKALIEELQKPHTAKEREALLANEAIHKAEDEKLAAERAQIIAQVAAVPSRSLVWYWRSARFCSSASWSGPAPGVAMALA